MTAQSAMGSGTAVIARFPVAMRIAVVRIAFGAIWAFDAWLKWQPAFIRDYTSVLAEGSKDQAGFLRPWFDFWLRAAAQYRELFAYGTAVIETLIAIALVSASAAGRCT
jgi:hypothetical protein